jgi:hypothetical protein
MELKKGDIEAIARYRAGKGKFMLGMSIFGLVWILCTLVSLYLITIYRELLIMAIVGIVVFAIWGAVYLVMIELRTKELVVKIRKEENDKNT